MTDEQSAFQGRTNGEASPRPFFNSLDDKFTISTFLFEWATQTFWPLNAPIVYFLKSRQHLHNQQLIFYSCDSTNAKIFTMVQSYLLPALCYACFIFLLRTRDELARHGVMASEVASPLCFFFVHRLCIAAKYGFLSRDEYQQLCEQSDYDTATRWLAEANVLSAWMGGKGLSPLPRVARSEVQVSARRNLVDTEDAEFVINGDESEIACWRRMCLQAEAALCTEDGNRDGAGIECEGEAKEIDVATGPVAVHDMEGALHAVVETTPGTDVRTGTDTGDGDGNGNGALRVSLTALLNHLCSRGPAGNAWLKPFVACLVMGRVIIPFVHRGACAQASGGGAVQQSSVATGACVVATVTNALFYMATINFLFTGCVHFTRQAEAILDLGDLTRLSKAERSEYPILSLTQPGNIRSWLYARHVLQDFGRRYEKRLRAYASVALVALLGYMVSLGIEVGTALAANKGLGGAKNSHENMKCSLMNWYCIYDGCAFAIMFGITIQAGIASNDSRTAQVVRFIKHRVRLRDRRSNTSCASVTRASSEALAECDELLDTAVASLNALHEDNPVTVMGMEATASLLVSLVTLVLTVLWLWGSVAATGKVISI